MTRPPLRASALRLFPLAWPVFVGQIAVLAFSTVDTVMTARASALDLAALAIGGSIYISVFVGLMGVILAVGPIAGQLFGASQIGGGHRGQREVARKVLIAIGVAARVEQALEHAGQLFGAGGLRVSRTLNRYGSLLNELK